MAARRRAGQSAGMARFRRPLQGHRRPAPAGEVRAARRRRRRGRGDRRRHAVALGHGGHRGRPVAPHLHLLPSRARAGRAGGAHAARGVRPRDGGDRTGVSFPRADARAAHRAREGQDSRRPHSLPGSGAGRTARATRERAPRDLPRLQRRLLGVLRRIGDAARPVRGGDPLGPALGRPAAGAGGDRIAGAHAAAGIAPDGPGVARWGARPARRPGSFEVERRPDRRGRSVGAARARLGPDSAPTPSRRQSRQSTRRQRPLRPPTGARSSSSTMRCCASSPPP